MKLPLHVPHLMIVLSDINIEVLSGTQEATDIGRQLVQGCREVGFAYFRNTGIHQAEVESVFEWSKKLFSLPIETKMLALHPKESWKHQGYTNVCCPRLQRLHYNWLPEQVLPGFRDAASAFFDTCHRFKLQKLLPALRNIHREGENRMRLLHYPSVPAESKMNRINAHMDFGTCAMLFQDDVGGLEVEILNGSGNFVPAPPIPGTVVFNIGDLLMRWSNGTLKSTLHRIRAPPNDET
ncbi:Clavaminate synthase-like protein [Rhizopogon vinicolor AM-OR11-026]|uniref:Clavaminate synthase-like protein n=1 Tax=Rhizopogon vinicolor AM-OR11-026 TaxID=1314800 RepID=A0A1B7MVR5_9AGAM|nr:Clavaminate synthase-like protein [Rhizopogon vinicolor AM-OR11-026]